MKKTTLFLIACFVLVGNLSILKSESGQTGEVFLAKTVTIYDLRGLWRFKVGDNQDFASAEYDDSGWDWISVPGRWQMKEIPDKRVGWYRLRFRLSDGFQVVPLAIQVPVISDAHELYINGEKVGGAGKISADGTLVKKSSPPGVYEIPNTLLTFDKSNIIAIRVADTFGLGGVETNEFYIGRKELIDLSFAKFITWNISVVVILAALSIFSFFLYVRFVREKSYLYFSLFSFLLSLVLFGYYSLPYYVFDNFLFAYYIFHTGINIAIFFVFRFAYSYFDLAPDFVYKTISVCSGLLFAIMVVAPIHPFMKMFYTDISVNLALFVDAIGFIFLLYVIAREIVRQTQGARIMGLGAAFAILCFLNDILGYLLNLNNRRFGLEGTVVFMIAISFAMFFKFAKIHSEFEPIFKRPFGLQTVLKNQGEG